MPSNGFEDPVKVRGVRQMPSRAAVQRNVHFTYRICIHELWIVELLVIAAVSDCDVNWRVPHVFPARCIGSCWLESFIGMDVSRKDEVDVVLVEELLVGVSEFL